MIKELTEEQQKIVDYSYIHGIRETTKLFGCNYDHVSYLRQKYMRLKKQEANLNNRNNFIQLPLDEIKCNFEKNNENNEEKMITFISHGCSFQISKEDFKKVFFND